MLSEHLVVENVPVQGVLELSVIISEFRVSADLILQLSMEVNWARHGRGVRA